MRSFLRPQLWLLCAWLLVAVITVLSLMPPLHLEELGAPTWNDKVGHFLAYFTLSAWCAQLYQSAPALRNRLLLCLALGATMEGLQSLTSTRSADWYDMLANTIGVSIGGLSWFTPMAGWLQRWDRAKR